MSVFPPYYGIVNEMPVFGTRMHLYDILVHFGGRKTVLVIWRSCWAHFRWSRRQLLLHSYWSDQSCLSLVVCANSGEWWACFLWLPCRVDDDVEYANNQSIICLVVCCTHGLCHSGMMSVFPPYYGIVNEMPLFGTRMHLYDILVHFGGRKTVLVIWRSCWAHFRWSRRQLLLHFYWSDQSCLSLVVCANSGEWWACSLGVAEIT